MRLNKEKKKELRKKVPVAELTIQSYIQNLFNNTEFISDIKKIKEDHAIPSNGYTNEEMWGGGHWNENLKTDLYFFTEDFEKIQIKYNLPLFWTREIKNWILTNTFSFEEKIRDTMISVHDIKQLVKEVDSKDPGTKSMGITSLRTISRDNPVIIAIHPDMSKTAVQDFITRNFENKIKPLQAKYKIKGSLIGKVRSKNFDTQRMKDRIMELYKQDLPRKEITEQINREFGVSKNYTDINTIIRNQKKIKL